MRPLRDRSLIWVVVLRKAFNFRCWRPFWCFAAINGSLPNMPQIGRDRIRCTQLPFTKVNHENMIVRIRATCRLIDDVDLLCFGSIRQLVGVVSDIGPVQAIRPL